MTPASATVHAPWPVCPGTVAGLTAELPAAALEILTDAQLAALTDWDDAACVAATMTEAARRDAADTSGPVAVVIYLEPVWGPRPWCERVASAPVVTPAAEAVPAVPAVAPASGKRRPNARMESLLEEYRLARHAWELRMEAQCAGYAWEEEEFREFNPPPTWKAFLIGSRAAQ